MFFVASKVLWALVAPVNLALALAILGVLFIPRHPRGGRFAALVGLGAMIVAATTPLGPMMIRPLEGRFPAPAADAAAPYGIIVLGGAIDDLVSDARGQVVLREGGSRLTEAAALARRYPGARIVYTGGSSALSGADSKEAEQGRDLLIRLGVDPTRIAVETRSRNTYENAQFTAAMVDPKPEQDWWLVTSAYHMPRAMGLFQKAGFSARAYPVDYHTYGDARDLTYNLNPVEGLRTFELGVHEWVGLFAYHADGKIDSWFPGP
jgi:uncharacterized SAM-binding protein YcdF (DUF218 family)